MLFGGVKENFPEKETHAFRWEGLKVDNSAEKRAFWGFVGRLAEPRSWRELIS